MPHFLNTRDPDFSASFERFLQLKREAETDVDGVVSDIINDVRHRGLDAVLEYSAKFDRVALSSETLAFGQREIDEAISGIPVVEREALELAATRIRAFHQRQLPKNEEWTDDAGVRLGWRWTPVDTAGLYVPGGLASYPSSVLMNAIPAKVAGVGHLIMTVPTPDDQFNPLVLLAARLAGVDAVYRVGGAQAIAAMAYGAGPITKVDTITGPGNAYVASAKRQVFGQVGIDMVAGPSEVLIIADGSANPEWVALDLMAQAEHDESAQSILVTDDPDFGSQVASAVDGLLKTLERRSIAGASWDDFGAVIVVSNLLDEAAGIANQIAPEHLEIQTEDPDSLAGRIRHAGAIFLGSYTAEAVGDYIGGPNHVLPTAGSARFSSGLSVLNFMKRTTISSVSPAALRQIGPAAAALARSESLEAHALSLERRLKVLN